VQLLLLLLLLLLLAPRRQASFFCSPLRRVLVHPVQLRLLHLLSLRASVFCLRACRLSPYVRVEPAREFRRPACGRRAPK